MQGQNPEFWDPHLNIELPLFFLIHHQEEYKLKEWAALMILVYIDNLLLGLGAGFYLNATSENYKKHFNMYSYITEELPDVVNNFFPVDGSRVSISGHSMGGHGALTIGLKNPGKYRSISAWAPITNPSQVPWGQKAFNGYLSSKEEWANYDALELIKNSNSNNK